MEALYVRQAIIPTFFRRGQVFVIIVWQSIHSRSDTNKTGAKCLSFYYPRLLYCPYHVLAVMLLSQHRVSSSKTVGPRAQCGVRCTEHTIKTWSSVCSAAPHTQFSKGTSPHLNKFSRLTPARRRLSLTEAVRGNLILIGLALMILQMN